MLSVLIPNFNYNALPLVEVVKEQCVKASIIFEIICQDDASNSALNTENEKINALENCHFFINTENLGRGRNRNSLVSKAKYDYVLFLDSDTLPAKDHFIELYLNEIRKKETIVFGGIIYDPEKPKQENLLRWVYGQSREALPVEKRKKKPYCSTLTSNILIKKDVFLYNSFNDNITTYGYEDVVWVKNLQEKSVPITQIDNPTFHIDIETSALFLKKIHQSLENLHLISSLDLIVTSDNRILKTHKRISAFGLPVIFSFIYDKFHKRIETNLLSNHPVLFLLDIYKLCYFCKINSK